MPSASNGKSEKVPSPEATETPVRQIMTVIDHKIRNLEKRKSKLTSYRDLQKSGKDLNSDQKIAVAKYDEVAQTLEFARDLSKQISSIALAADREAKKQAKKEAWVRNATETNKIRDVLLIMDCLVQMGTTEAREDFLKGANGAAKLTEDDLKILDDLYPEVTPKHEIGEDGVSGFGAHLAKAAEHLYSIIDAKPREVLGTTYAHIKDVVDTVHGCGYFDRAPPAPEEPAPDPEPVQPPPVAPSPPPACPPDYPAPPAAAAVPAPAYPLRAVPAMTLQELEHAYFSQQYARPRPVAEVIGSQNFFFLQESEIDSPTETPPPPEDPVPTRTFTNRRFAPPDEPPYPPASPVRFTAASPPRFAPESPERFAPESPSAFAPGSPPRFAPESPPRFAAERPNPPSAADDERQAGPPPHQGSSDSRPRRYGGGSRGRAAHNGFRGRGSFQPRHNDYRPRQYDGYRGRGDSHFGNGDSEEGPRRGRRPPAPRRPARAPAAPRRDDA